ncbi:MAG: hemerythrin family protein [Bryobacteraceae bacterium]|jgi:hemerythrin-like metal-binding protein
MASVKRSSVHAVYIPKLDAEHRVIQEAVVELRRTVEIGGLTEQAQAALQGLMYRLSAHLSGEERMMRSSVYPAYAWHKRQHDAARKRVKEFAGRVREGDPAAVPELLDFFKAWLRDHTGLHDRMMGAYLRNFDRGRHKTVS